MWLQEMKIVTQFVNILVVEEHLNELFTLYMDGFILVIKVFACHCFSSFYSCTVIHVYEFKFSSVPYL